MAGLFLSSWPFIFINNTIKIQFYLADTKIVSTFAAQFQDKEEKINIGLI